VAHVNDANAAEFIESHPTTCALMPNCVKSGYAVYADGKLYKFDQDGNKMAMRLLKTTKSKKGLLVEVEGSVEGDTIQVKKISESTS
jgi:hypothetical protein